MPSRTRRPATLVMTLLVTSLPVSGGELDALRRAPTVVPFDVKTLPAAEHLATPAVRTLVGYTRRVLHLPDGHTLGVLSYSGSAAANWLFLVDARDLSSRRFPVPNNDIASHAAALGSDGNIYVMPYRTGRAYRFDVAKSEFALLEVTGLPAGEFTWDAIGGARDGCIYFGTYPNACVGRYEIATGKTTVWPHVAPNTTYVSHLALDGDGVRFKAWGPDEVWMRLDAKAAQPTRADAPPPPPPATSSPTSQPEAVAEPSWTERVEGAGAIVTIGHYGSLTRKDLATGAITRGRLDNRAPGGNHLMFLESITPSCVLGAHYSQQHLFRIDPATGEVRSSEDMVARTPGQPMCAVGLHGKAYLGIYIQAVIAELDPAKPFSFRTNPREIGELHTRHRQTRPSAAVTDGERVYVSSEGDYSLLGGVLAVVDPKAGTVNAYPRLVPDQNLTSLAYDPKNKLVWGGTNRWGQQRSAPPTQPSAALYAFDPKARSVVATLTPWPGADEVRVAGCTDDGTVIATAGGGVVHVDGASREVIFNGPWPFPPSAIRRGANGDPHLLSGGTLLRWDLKANTLAAVAQAPAACRFFTEPSPGTWLFADATTVYRVTLGR